MKFGIDVGEINLGKEGGLEIRPNGRVSLSPRPLHFHSDTTAYQRVVGGIFAFATEEPKDKRGTITFDLEKDGTRTKITYLHGDELPQLIEIDSAALRIQLLE